MNLLFKGRASTFIPLAILSISPGNTILNRITRTGLRDDRNARGKLSILHPGNKNVLLLLLILLYLLFVGLPFIFCFLHFPFFFSLCSFFFLSSALMIRRQKIIFQASLGKVKDSNICSTCIRQPKRILTSSLAIGKASSYIMLSNCGT